MASGIFPTSCTCLLLFTGSLSCPSLCPRLSVLSAISVTGSLGRGLQQGDPQSVDRDACRCPFLDMRPCLPRRDQRPLPWAALGVLRVRVLSGSRRTHEAFSDWCPRLPRSPSRHSHVPEASARAIGPHAAILRADSLKTHLGLRLRRLNGPGPPKNKGTERKDLRRHSTSYHLRVPGSQPGAGARNSVGHE